MSGNHSHSHESSHDVRPISSKGKHYHFIIWGYTSFEPTTQTYMEIVILDLIAGAQEEALAKAKSLVTKPGYLLRSVIEHFDGACGISPHS